jgi:hypothetical protein
MREVLRQRASGFKRSACKAFAFSKTETVSIEAGNRLLQAAEIVWILYMVYISSMFLFRVRVISIHKIFLRGLLLPTGANFRFNLDQL